ncbi:MAG: hypothetical protein ABFD57_11470 [Smithella sp.]|nr:hypothetical protein [Syntrophaceae bacterium]
MSPSNTDQEWQQLQTRIENFFANHLRNDSRNIEDKSQGTVQLLEMPAEYRQKIPGSTP